MPPSKKKSKKSKSGKKVAETVTVEPTPTVPLEPAPAAPVAETSITPAVPVEEEKMMGLSKKMWMIIGAVIAVIVIALIVYFVMKKKSSGDAGSSVADTQSGGQTVTTTFRPVTTTFRPVTTANTTPGVGNPTPTSPSSSRVALLYPQVKMTSNSTDGYIATASSQTLDPAQGIDGQAFKAFDEGRGGWWNFWATEDGYDSATGEYTGNASTSNIRTLVDGYLQDAREYGEWLQIEMPVRIQPLKLYLSSHDRGDLEVAKASNPRVFMLLARNSPSGMTPPSAGDMWTVLYDNRTSEPVSNWTEGERKSFTLTNPTNQTFNVFRIVVSKVGLTDSVSIGEMEILGYPE